MKKIIVLTCMVFMIACNHTEENNQSNNQFIRPMSTENKSTYSNDESFVEEMLMNEQRSINTQGNYFLTDFFEEREPTLVIPGPLIQQIENFNSINQAKVIFFNDDAYVAILSNRPFTTEMKMEIKHLIASYQPTLTHIMISMKKDDFQNLSKYVNKIEEQLPLKEWYVDFSTTVESVFQLNY